MSFPLRTQALFPLDRRRFLTSALAASLVPAAASQAGPAPLSVVASTGMIADTARVIGGDAVEVTALMGPGIDPHSYRATRSDIVALTKADLVLWHGLGLEVQLQELLAKLAARKPVQAVGEAVPEALRLAHPDYAGRPDPHVWMVPDLWRHVAGAIAEALTAARPEAGADIAARTEAFLAGLEDLQARVATAMATIPEPARLLVTAHDAFGYFGRAFGIEVVGIQGISTESEAGLHRIGELVDLIVARRIAAVFVESSVSDRNIRALIEGAAAQGHAVRIGGELYSDAMGPSGSYEGTYVGMMDHNATTITRGLGGDLDPGGLYGQLSGRS